MPRERAHVLEDQKRTDDVIAEVDITFKELLLSERTQAGLEASGFRKPSPIQTKAIPLGRCGFDLIVQAKSGTGKTCVFTIVALEMVKTDLDRLQVLILSPTREISVQIKDVISSIGQGFKDLKVSAFIGGLPLASDKKNLQKCQIAVGAPGRIKHLVTEGIMKLDAVRLFVLDEADKLMEESFRSDVSFIFLHLPKTKQIIASSATYPPSLEEFISRYTNNPTRISFGHGIFLKGIRQFVSVVPSHPNLFSQTKIKEAELLRILSSVTFKQCLVFLNYQSRVESVCNKLRKEGFHSTFIGSFQSQVARLKSIAHLKEFACRVFVSTDLTSRGIDAENVNLVINLDVPYDSSTYMHRIGRAGRYGTQGLAVTIAQSGTECLRFKKMLSDIGGENFEISVFPTGKVKGDIWQMKDCEIEKMPVTEKDVDHNAIVTEKECGKTKVELDVNKNKKNEMSKYKKQQNRNFELITEFISGYSKTRGDFKLKNIKELLEEENLHQTITDETNKPAEETLNKLTEFSKEILDFSFNLEKDDWEKFNRELTEDSNKELLNNFHEKDKCLDIAETQRWHIAASSGGCNKASEEEMKVGMEERNKVKEEEEEEEFEEDEVREEEKDEENSDSDYHDKYDISELSNSWFATWQAQTYAIRDYLNFVRQFRSTIMHQPV